MTNEALPPCGAVTACLLAGGEGRRMQGRDKGLVPYRGRPLGDWVLGALAAQKGVRVEGLMVSANRNPDAYAALLSSHHREGMRAGRVFPDDPDLPPASGPLAGILTALRHAGPAGDWLLVAPCDLPHLPADLAARLLAEAWMHDADLAIPHTVDEDGSERFHWACALVHKRVCPRTEALFVSGERKLGTWARSLRQVGVSFGDDAAFTNMNTLETLHGRA